MRNANRFTPKNIFMPGNEWSQAGLRGKDRLLIFITQVFIMN